MRSSRAETGGSVAILRCCRGVSAAILDSTDGRKRCIGLGKSRPLGDTSKKQKRKVPTVGLLDELVWEILIRLPVKSLLRFKCVSKAWHAIISDPSFIQLHLELSATKWEQKPSLLITPHTLDHVIKGEKWPTTFSTNIFFYQWQQGASEVRPLYGRDLDGEFKSVCYFAHCDGLVLVPTNTNVYIFNPATRDVVTLPESSRNILPGPVNLPVGFGRDPHTGMYKVVRSFFRPRDPKTGV